MACSSLCALGESQTVTIAPTPVQTMHDAVTAGINSWFKFSGEAGMTYRIEADNNAKMYIYDAGLMSGGTYQPDNAMLSGTEEAQILSGDNNIQTIEWTCAASGEYAILISQSRWDCRTIIINGNDVCKPPKVSVTKMTAEEAGIQTLHLVPNAEPVVIGTACKIDGDATVGDFAALPVCHYRTIDQRTPSNDMGWLNGKGGMSFVMSLDGHAGKTYTFSAESLEQEVLATIIHQDFWEVDHFSSGGGQTAERLRFGYGGTNGMHTSFTLYPPAAVGGARGWENHDLNLGQWGAGNGHDGGATIYKTFPGTVQGDAKSFTWACPASGSWLIVVEANCDAFGSGSHKQCSSGFKLTAVSEDLSGEDLSCEADGAGDPVCSGPEIVLELDAESDVLVDGSEARAQMAQMFRMEQPPALTFVHEITPHADQGSSEFAAQSATMFVDVKIEVRAPSSDARCDKPVRAQPVAL